MLKRHMYTRMISLVIPGVLYNRDLYPAHRSSKAVQMKSGSEIAFVLRTGVIKTM